MQNLIKEVSWIDGRVDDFRCGFVFWLFGGSFGGVGMREVDLEICQARCRCKHAASEISASIEREITQRKELAHVEANEKVVFFEL